MVLDLKCLIDWRKSMVIIYFSLTGQTRKFVDKLNMDVLELNPADPFVEINEPFIIVTPAAMIKK